MDPKDLTHRTEQIVADTLFAEEPVEVERLMIGDALIVREGNHYRIEIGDDDPGDPTRSS
ncbi:MAG: hypothetical protein ACE5FG_03435 [Myxococcota bacterium]